MTSDLTVAIADGSRIALIRSGLPLSGRGVWFNSSSLASALEAIKTQEPRLVAIDALFAQTQQGQVFIKRVDSLAMAGCVVRLIIRVNGAWTTGPRETPPDEAHIANISSTLLRPVAVVIPPVVAATKPSAAAAVAGSNTRRAPRFPMVDALNAAVEGGQASLVNISVLGAQIVSQPVLRPGQTVKIALPDANEMLRLTAHVAWSWFQQTRQGATVYRAGISFTDAAQETLDDYCRRYGAENPLPTY